MTIQGVLQIVTDCGLNPLGATLTSNAKRNKARLANFVLDHRSWFIAAFQALLILVSLVLAWLLRFNFELPYRALLLSTAPLLIFVRLVAIQRFGLLHGWWRYTNLDDALDIVKAIAVGSAVFVFCLRIVLGTALFPRSIYALEPLITLILLTGIRVCSRVLADSAKWNDKRCKDVIVIGAGAAAQMAIREMDRPGSGYRVVACIDDDRTKRGMKIEGVPVLGMIRDLPQLAHRYSIEDVVIAIPSATTSQADRFADVCAEAHVRFKTVPSLQAIIEAGTGARESSEICLEELLGREPVETDLEAVRRKIQGRVVLITGAAGSIGSELCRQVLQYSPAKLVCLDQNETGMFYLQNELTGLNGAARGVTFCVADVADCARIQTILAAHKPDIVFHAAAYKHVPVMEANVYEAVKNNVFALMDLLEIAEREGCSNFILVSSDKAVNPVNIMGATKRVCELIVSCRPASKMHCSSVRFGNVLGSNGSVVPIFQKQIREHQPLTVTHPDMTRFFMTMHEAVSLVLQAFCLGQHGETLVLDMGKPVRILDLAKSLVRLCGKSESEVDIQFTGLREGEKLSEELWYRTEEIHPTSCAKVNRIVAPMMRWTDLERHLNELMALIPLSDDDDIREKIKKIVPEYSNRVDAARHAERSVRKGKQSLQAARHSRIRPARRRRNRESH